MRLSALIISLLLFSFASSAASSSLPCPEILKRIIKSTGYDHTYNRLAYVLESSKNPKEDFLNEFYKIVPKGRGLYAISNFSLFYCIERALDGAKYFRSINELLDLLEELINYGKYGFTTPEMHIKYENATAGVLLTVQEEIARRGVNKFLGELMLMRAAGLMKYAANSSDSVFNRELWSLFERDGNLIMNYKRILSDSTDIVDEVEELSDVFIDTYEFFKYKKISKTISDSDVETILNTIILKTNGGFDIDFTKDQTADAMDSLLKVYRRDAKVRGSTDSIPDSILNTIAVRFHLKDLSVEDYDQLLNFYVDDRILVLNEGELRESLLHAAELQAARKLDELSKTEGYFSVRMNQIVNEISTRYVKSPDELANFIIALANSLKKNLNYFPEVGRPFNEIIKRYLLKTNLTFPDDKEIQGRVAKAVIDLVETQSQGADKSAVFHETSTLINDHLSPSAKRK